ncbi:uncharacterized protein F5891DRAFT_1180680 [Suillus fuscotomentosus]|uniref:Uncharacterized protein n=1 Tax=Suillus fuscotomentosus TaxID=1912939 RepID=A0AAD4EK84_9AGAM|nr:uncharacterized protein F5891DRAFT_1180680 [Suillus fuscotomentosus]KAG1907655.1 hypothetical protein F5891DRAFT_1180680 [Suillus fuscotomentosus]
MLQEDIAYLLSGIFGVCLRVDYGEKKQITLGWLLQEIVAWSGDITALDWVGKSSEFNNCLPADITLYGAPPCILPSLSEEDSQSSISSLWGIVPPQSALKLYQTHDYQSIPHFAYRQLHLPCIVFLVTEARWRPEHDWDTYHMYEFKSDRLRNVQITTEDKFILFSPARPLPVWQMILLVRPWSRHLLELHDPADNAQSVDNWLVPKSPSHNLLPEQTEPIYADSLSQAFISKLEGSCTQLYKLVEIHRTHKEVPPLQACTACEACGFRSTNAKRNVTKVGYSHIT